MPNGSTHGRLAAFGGRQVQGGRRGVRTGWGMICLLLDFVNDPVLSRYIQLKERILLTYLVQT